MGCCYDCSRSWPRRPSVRFKGQQVGTPCWCYATSGPATSACLSFTPRFLRWCPTRSFSSRSRPHSSAHPGGTFLTRLFHRSPSDTHDTSLSSPLDWARNLLRPRGQSDEGTELQGRSPTVVEVPYAQGKRRNACAREKRKKLLLPLKNSTASSSQPPKPNTTQQSGTATQTQPSLQPQPAGSNSSTTPAVGDNTAATTSAPSHPDVILRQAGLWTRFWLFIGCLSPEFQDGRH
ncbi:hypothetical protein DFJ58DRAFT_109209 [Suillus subalutaceus]|uniref:uncharacterized protein n=1 Tax=Suillus subalutaceus TaxID=48586 RepID=UPI001B8846B2|nr:uncharacterized protein DFJ58DRAFT_109209 [Suillus subalutaceus]KAG1839338.1 hypothetical protein DFJ58DRAFT_109209 [Suillus subalutaceus]